MNLLFAALAPVAVILVWIYIKDKYEKESKRTLAMTFLLGGILSIIITTILYLASDIVIPLKNEKSIIQQFIKAFFVVALIEEFSKYVIVRFYSQRKRYFNEPFDGIIYCVMVSMGFAAVENIAYVAEGGLPTAIVRAFTAIPAHATFGILMGYYMGKAKFSKHSRVKLNLIGLGLAILFHGAYDFFLFIGFIPGMTIGAFIALTIAIILSRKAIKRHQMNSNFKV
ncbi:MAG: PrsW family intramembrane metalloprotease [Flavobacteriaceae bacterium]|nr:PrsW family intramembrane metalloprotease [Bacteroidia bacterium]NNK83406.1 PrsW family intramembrane metalloprotease [Flavobacteriaceae bacterium]